MLYIVYIYVEDWYNVEYVYICNNLFVTVQRGGMMHYAYTTGI